jgi:hypothetical protein
MGREFTYYGVSSDGMSLMLPFFGVSSCAVNIIRADNLNSTGKIQACNVIPKVYAYDSELYLIDGVQRMYGFPSVDQSFYGAGTVWPLSTATAAKETITGRALSITGGPLFASNYTVQRLYNKSFAVPPNATVTDNVAGLICVQDGGGAAWSLEAWVFRVVAGTAYFYLESNAGITAYMGFYIDSAGHIGISGVGFTGTGLASVGTVPMNQWSHIVVAFDGASHVTFTINDVPGAALAYTHGGGVAGNAMVQINPNTGFNYIQSLAIYAYDVLAWQIDRHYRLITGVDYDIGGVWESGLMGQGASAQVIFGNGGIPNESPSASTISTMFLPLQGIGRILFMNGVYQWEIHTEESDV